MHSSRPRLGANFFFMYVSYGLVTDRSGNVIIQDHFTKDKSEYHRTVAIMPAYYDQIAHYISTMREIPIGDARDFVIEELRSGRMKANIPAAHHLNVKPNGDREKKSTSLKEYVDRIVEENLLVAPTLTTYVQPEVEESLYAKYVTVKVKTRKEFKDLKFVYKMKKDPVMTNRYDLLQNSVKTKINSLSGAHGSKGTIVNMKSGHSTLTSVCRVLTSSCNANNEKLLMGNRHYWNPQITLDNLIALANDAKNHAVAEAVEQYGIHIPTTEQVMKMVYYCTSEYWRDEAAHEHIRNYVHRLTDIEKAFVLYGGDMYHLAMFNEKLVKGMIDDMSAQAVDIVIDLDVAKDIMKSVNSDVKALASLICAEIIAGRSVGDLWKTDVMAYLKVAQTAYSVIQSLDKYGLLIRALYRPNLLAPSFYDIQKMYRRAVPASDTDSSIFTNQWWVKWVTGRYGFDVRSYNVSYVMTFFITQTVINVLAILSRNLGLSQDRLRHFEMKNEYYFPVFILTLLAKHYTNFMSAQEGNILPELDKQVKGVNLRNSAASPDVIEKLNLMIDDIMLSVMDEKPISIVAIKSTIATIEKAIYDDICAGGSKYLRTLQAKDEESYSQKENAPAVQQHRFWEEVLSAKYGAAPPLPYRAVSLKLTVNSKRRMAQWVETIEDRALARRLETWLLKNGKDKMGTVRLPEEIVNEVGIPVEILNVALIRDIVKMIVNPFYIMVSSLGFPLLDDDATYMFSDDEWDEPVIIK